MRKQLTDCSSHFFNDKKENRQVQNMSGYICKVLETARCLTKDGKPRRTEKCHRMTTQLKVIVMAKCPPR